MVTNTDLKAAFERVISAKAALQEATEKELQAAMEKKEAEAHILRTVDSKELGPNEAARQAKIQSMAAKEYEAAKASEAEKRAALNIYELAVLQLDCLKWQVRNDITPHEERVDELPQLRDILTDLLGLVGQTSVYTECGADFNVESVECGRCKDWPSCSRQLTQVHQTEKIKKMIGGM